jgi:molybdate transport system substrate-binding protein
MSRTMGPLPGAFGRPLSIRMPRLLVVLCAAAALLTHPAHAQNASITVYAAASMKDAVDDINAAFTAKTKTRVTAIYAASSSLAKSIEEGAQPDVFASADLDWMDYVANKKLIKSETRTNLLGNKLVLIAPKAFKLDKVEINPGFDLAKLAGDGHIATGDTNVVPVGKYAQAALEKLGSWAAAEHKFTMVVNVRAALRLVASGEAVLGIVYETDAKAEPNVKIVGYFPQDSYPPVIYPVALTATAKSEATAYLDFLRSDPAQVVFEKYGFSYRGKAGL